MALQWTPIDFHGKRAVLFDTKNGDTRALLLSSQFNAKFKRLRERSNPHTSLLFASARKPSAPMKSEPIGGRRSRMRDF
jgi:hypothetical protein